MFSVMQDYHKKCAKNHTVFYSDDPRMQSHLVHIQTSMDILRILNFLIFEEKRWLAKIESGKEDTIQTEMLCLIMSRLDEEFKQEKEDVRETE